MNTAVPETRAGRVATTRARKSSIGSARAVRRAATMRRPVFHVVMSVNSSEPITSGSHPPWVIFSAFAPKNARSMNRKMPVTTAATAGCQPHRSVATTWSSAAVMTIVSVTAMPYAAASAVDEPNPMTMTIVLTMRAQLTCGT
jgi:hypothetical protein